MLLASPARADQEPCAVERAEAEQVPPSAEDVRGYDECVEKVRAAAAAEVAAREAAKQKAEQDAREAIERARDDREKPLHDARGLVVLGACLFSGGGIAVTAAGGMGIAGLVTPPRGIDGNGMTLGMGMMFGIVGGALMIPGAVLLGLGARDHMRAKRVMAVNAGSAAK